MFRKTKPEPLHIGYVYLIQQPRWGSSKTLIYWGAAFPNSMDDHPWFNAIWPEHAQIPQVQNASRIDSVE